VVVLVQTRRVLERPWCILELLTAIDNGIPIVCVRPMGVAHEYDFASARQLLANPQVEIERRNPGSYAQIEQNWNGSQPLDEILPKMLTMIPNCISTRVDYSMSKRVLHAMMEDVVETVERASKTLAQRGRSVSSSGPVALSPPHPLCPPRSVSNASVASAPELWQLAAPPPPGMRRRQTVSCDASTVSGAPGIVDQTTPQ